MTRNLKNTKIKTSVLKYLFPCLCPYRALYYHLKFHDHFALSAGLFQEADLSKLSQQIFIDEKAAYYDLANDTPMLTGEEAFAAFEAANGESD